MGLSTPPLTRGGWVGSSEKKGGTSLCLLNTSQWARLPIKEYFIKLFDKIASHDALFFKRFALVYHLSFSNVLHCA